MTDISTNPNEAVLSRTVRKPSADMMSTLMTYAAKVYSCWDNGCLDGEWVGGISMLDQPLIEACFALADQVEVILSAFGIEDITHRDMFAVKRTSDEEQTLEEPATERAPRGEHEVWERGFRAVKSMAEPASAKVAEGGVCKNPDGKTNSGREERMNQNQRKGE